MRKIICSSIGHNLNKAKFSQSSDFVCTACAEGKLILRPSHLKIKNEPLKFLERIQGDICGPIQPLSGPFRYFIVLIDASTRRSHVYLLSTRNHAFAKIIAQIIKLQANYPEHRIQSIRMDNAAEFTSRAFNDYCLALGALSSICPYSKWFSRITYKEDKAYCKTNVDELQVTNHVLRSCSLTRCRSNSIASNCLS